MRFSHVSETKAFFKSLALFVLVLLGGTGLFIVGSSLIGYLPYSDRPGPGWHGWFPARSLRSIAQLISFAFSFATLCLPAAVIYGSALILATRALEWFRPRRVFVAMIGALASGYLGVSIIGSVGWLIAIDVLPVLVGGMLGLAYGACLLPARSLGRGDQL